MRKRRPGAKPAGWRDLRAGAALLAALALSACSGGPWSERVDVETGREITYDERLFRDIEHVLRACASPLVVDAGLETISGSRLLLADCFDPRSDSVDEDRILAEAPDRSRARALLTILRLISAPLPEPVPRDLYSQIDESQLQPFSPVLAILERQIDSWSDAPDFVRDMARDALRAALGDACVHRTGVDVNLRAARFANIRLSWERVDGRRVLRLAALLADAAPQASARIVNNFSCNGSSDNAVNGLLQSIMPEGERDVTLVGGRLRADFALSIALDPETRRGRVVARLHDFRFAADGVVVAHFNQPIADSLLDEAIARAELTADRVSQRAERRLRGPMGRLAAPLAELINESLDINDERDDRLLSVAGVEVDTSAGRGAHTMRFSLLRTDKLCFFRPGGRIVDGRFVAGEGETVCVDRPDFGAQKPEAGNCVKLPDGRIICFPFPRG
ncbi:MAG: hypothetical protein JNK46_18150 [Methylobacteriaceae bacterium]|nr:hypothetical protein [Methylobacteriaceae bacterium]